MSKKGRRIESKPERVVVALQGGDEAVALVVATPGLPREVVEHAVREEIAAAGAPDCTRFVTYDSLRWHCNCGASGRVGRTADGIPDTSGDILRHQPGVSKE